MCVRPPEKEGCLGRKVTCADLWGIVGFSLWRRVSWTPDLLISTAFMGVLLELHLDGSFREETVKEPWMDHDNHSSAETQGHYQRHRSP